MVHVSVASIRRWVADLITGPGGHELGNGGGALSSPARFEPSHKATRGRSTAWILAQKLSRDRVQPTEPAS